MFHNTFLNLIPFHIFVYEASFEEYNKNEEKLSSLIAVYEDIMERLEQCVKDGIVTEYIWRIVVDMSKQVLEKISQKYALVRKGVSVAMGGKVLEHSAKTLVRQGRKEQLLEMIKKKLAKGKEVPQIADELEETEDNIRKLIEEL